MIHAVYICIIAVLFAVFALFCDSQDDMMLSLISQNERARQTIQEQIDIEVYQREQLEAYRQRLSECLAEAYISEVAEGHDRLADTWPVPVE